MSYRPTQKLTKRTKTAKTKNSSAIVNRRPITSMMTNVINRPATNQQLFYDAQQPITDCDCVTHYELEVLASTQWHTKC